MENVKEHTDDVSRNEEAACLSSFGGDESKIRCKKDLCITNNINELDKLEGFINDIAETCEWPMPLTMNINLALEEIVSNVVFYAYPKDTQGTADIEITNYDTYIVFKVTDSGKPFNPLAKSMDIDISLPAEQREIGGLGIFLTRKIMDEMEYLRKDGQNCLYMKKKL